jgi:pyruvate formate lyase activating enzyme
MKEALLYKKIEGNDVHCFLCGHQCQIKEAGFGLCGVRQNVKGKLYTHAYGRVIAAHIDPIEKKPFYHFMPGSSSFSIATIGCNFRCGFCQNWEISQTSFKEGDSGGQELSAQEIVEAAERNNCKSISYTYTEPTIFFEYALDTARISRGKDLYNNFVTNGYMSVDCLQMIRPYLDAANVDLKFFRDDSYRRVCKARLKPVLDSIETMHKMGIWVEVTTLVVPGENDSKEELRDIAKFIAGIDKNMPWHISRFHPNYRFTSYASTDEGTLKMALELGFNVGLRYVYAGNVYGWGNDTHCHNCKKLLVKREGFSVLENNIAQGNCSFCKTAIPGVFN